MFCVPSSGRTLSLLQDLPYFSVTNARIMWRWTNEGVEEWAYVLITNYFYNEEQRRPHCLLGTGSHQLGDRFDEISARWAYARLAYRHELQYTLDGFIEEEKRRFERIQQHPDSDLRRRLFSLMPWWVSTMGSEAVTASQSYHVSVSGPSGPNWRQSSNQSFGSAQHDQVQPPSGPGSWRNRQNQGGQAFTPTGPSSWRNGSAQHGEAFRPRIAIYAASPPLPQPQGQEDNLPVDLFTPRTFHSYSRLPILRASMQESSRRRTVRKPPGASTQTREGLHPVPPNDINAARRWPRSYWASAWDDPSTRDESEDRTANSRSMPPLNNYPVPPDNAPLVSDDRANAEVPRAPSQSSARETTVASESSGEVTPRNNHPILLENFALFDK